ncbi:hypothetical protein IT399_01705 [Candidatus Nomurabacteria bacterium]|nr:hypothetical protein [Candidatus Nomurabacteria bacterium]
MDPESKRLLEETLALTKENNKMLHKVRSVQKWATFWLYLKIFIIIGVALGVFYYIEPYVNKVADLYSSISGTTQKINNTNNSFQDFLKKIAN